MVREADLQPVAPDSEAHHLRSELLEVRERLHQRHGFDALIGQGPAHQRLLDQVRAAAETSVPVLIVGEPGTGKRLVARTIHQQGARSQAPLLPFDCAALPPEVLERELFGRGEPGGKPRLNLPEGSTLLIGDVLDLPRDSQSRLASTADRRVRILATTAGDPEAALKEERLRDDLYYALTTLVIRLRPLRQRLDDLSLLAQHLLERANQRGGRQRGGFSQDALAVLVGYDWPGNLRELARVIDDAHRRGDRDWIDADDLPAEIRGSLGAAYLPPPSPPPVTPLDDLLTLVEHRLIEQAPSAPGRTSRRRPTCSGSPVPGCTAGSRSWESPRSPSRRRGTLAERRSLPSDGRRGKVTADDPSESAPPRGWTDRVPVSGAKSNRSAEKRGLYLPGMLLSKAARALLPTRTTEIGRTGQ